MTFGTGERAEGILPVTDSRSRMKVDDRFGYGEIRVYAIGVVNGLEMTLIYMDVSETERRIISAWSAERHERAAYWQSVG